VSPTDDTFGVWALGGANIITAYNDFTDPTAPLPPPATNIQTPNCDARTNYCKSYTPYCNNNNTGVDPIYGCEDSDWATAARSRHTGGVNAVMAVGSVRFVNSSIDPLAWYAMFMIQGQVVSSNS